MSVRPVAPKMKAVGGSIDTSLELGGCVVHSQHSPLCNKRAADVVDITSILPRTTEMWVEEHDGTSVDHQSYLTMKVSGDAGTPCLPGTYLAPKDVENASREVSKDDEEKVAREGDSIMVGRMSMNEL
jgi:hypothetical protein